MKDMRPLSTETYAQVRIADEGELRARRYPQGAPQPFKPEEWKASERYLAPKEFVVEPNDDPPPSTPPPGQRLKAPQDPIPFSGK
jgi:hypothetical protein